MKEITLDFETYWDTRSGYTLGAMDTRDYILDERFEVLGVGIGVGTNDPLWIEGSEVPRVLARVPWDDVCMVAHNVSFDAAVLGLHYGHRPRRLACTAHAARCLLPPAQSCSLGKLAPLVGIEKGYLATDGRRLGDLAGPERERLGEYCRQDVRIARALYDLFYGRLPRHEWLVAEIVDRMALEPTVEVADAPVDWRSLGAVADPVRRDALYAKVLNDALFATLLRKLGAEPPLKGPEGKPKGYAFAKTDPGYRALWAHDAPGVRQAARLREDAKLVSRDARDAVKLKGAAKRGGPVPIHMRYAAAIPGDITGEIRTFPRDGVARRMLRAPEGSVMLVGDLSSIELRLCAYVAGQTDVLDTLRRGGDVYLELAQAMWGEHIQKGSHPTEHGLGKTATLACQYGLSGAGLQKRVLSETASVIDRDTADGLVARWRARNPAIVSLWMSANELMSSVAAGETGAWTRCAAVKFTPEGVVLPSGRPIHYPSLRADRRTWRYLAKERGGDGRSGKTVEVGTRAPGIVSHLMHGMARDQTCAAAVRMAQTQEVFPAWMNHDELVYVVPADRAEELGDALKLALIQPPPWALDIPLDAKVGTGPTYGEAK